MYLGKKGAVPKMSLEDEVIAEKKEDTLWRWFSRYIRLRDSDENGMCVCKTCGAVKSYKQMDAGHFVSRRWKPTKYREDNVYAQCVHCNQHLSGNLALYRVAIGEEKALELEDASRQPARKMWPSEVKTLSNYYREKAKREGDRVGVKF
jgi:hypothetical protein